MQDCKSSEKTSAFSKADSLGNHPLPSSITQMQWAEWALQAIADGVSVATGPGFFRTLVKSLAEVLEVEYAFVGELVDGGECVSTVAVWAHRNPAPNFEYNLAGTPCQQVVSRTRCSFPQSVQAQFPQDDLLVEMGVESYIGTPLTDSAGYVRGLLVAMDSRPMLRHELFLSLLQIFAERASAELERMRSQEALQHSEMLMRTLLDATPDAVYFKDGEGRWLLVNEAGLDLFDLKGADYQGKSYDQLAELVPQHTELLRECAACDEQVWKLGAPLREEKTVVIPGKPVRTLDVIKTPLFNPDGTRKGIVVIGRDISERKHAEGALRDSEELYRELFENANDIVYTTDLDGHLTSINKAGEQITGYSRKEVLGRHFTVVVAPEYVPSVQEMMRRKVEGADGTRFDLQVIAKNGRRLDLDINSRLIFHGWIPVGIQGVARDVTAKKLLESQLRQAQKMEAVGRLAGGVAHDFNNILTVIQGHSEILVNHYGPAHPLREHVDEILRAAERAAGLTRQLLAFSRKQVLETKVLDLNSTVTEMNKMLRRLIGEDIDLVFLPGDNLGRVVADPGQMEQVMLNLAVNARDAMPDGGRLIIETQNAELDDNSVRQHPVAPGRYVMLAVTDTGVGMDAETQSHLFEPFFTTKGQGKGTGLGLATVYGIVKQSGGYIWVYSEVGRGTTFKIYLPRVDSAADDTPPVRSRCDRLTGSETILLVEDETAVRDLSRKYLEAQGYAVLEARDSAEALRISAEFPNCIHLLLTDVVMPGMSGCELASRLQSTRPDLKVLYVSGYTNGSFKQLGVSPNSDAFLQKPFNLSELARRIHKILDSAA